MRRLVLALGLAGCADPVLVVDPPTSVGGTIHVVSAPAGVDCGGDLDACAHAFPDGTRVQLTASGGGGSCPIKLCVVDPPSARIADANNVCTVEMDGDVSVSYVPCYAP